MTDSISFLIGFAVVLICAGGLLILTAYIQLQRERRDLRLKAALLNSIMPHQSKHVAKTVADILKEKG